MNRRLLTVVLILVLALAIVPAPASAHTNHASVDSQVTADGTILVESAFISNAGFVVVHAINDNGEPGEPLASRYVPERSGFQTALSVQVDPADFPGNATTHEVWVVVHQDANGNGEFDPGTDNALSLFGQLAGERATVATGEDPGYVAAERFSPPSTEGGSVSVVAAALPADGYLVLQSEVDGEPGPVVGYVPLEAGEHTDVAVPLDTPVTSSDGTTQLYARLYTDDGDGSFSPESDSQVRTGGESVGTEFTVSVTGSSAGTPASDTSTTDQDSIGTVTTETAIVNTPTPTTVTTSTPTTSISTTNGQPGFGVAVATAALVSFGALVTRAVKS